MSKLVKLSVLIAGLLFCGILQAQRAPDIASTKHNLSVSGTGDVKAVAQTQICVFCHTPHGATTYPGAPLWNKQLSSSTYTTYTSASLDAETISGQLDTPAGSSKLCLSCHDGVMALGAVNVIGGQQNQTIALSGAGAGGVLPGGAGTQTGFTRNLDIDLRNDHPISLTYDTTLANLDGELYDPAVASQVGVRSVGSSYSIPLEATGPSGEAQVQCGSCHDPHMSDPTATASIKFLRLNRFQQGPPGQGLFDEGTDILCIGCHDKKDWATSAHADSTVADETYSTSASTLREFPAGLSVANAACLNCHDPHTVHGARRLTREGTDSTASPKSGGQSAIEETCYQCHSATPAVNPATGDVPDIESDFLLTRSMPITSINQPAGVEMHEVLNSDLEESQLRLGKANLNNRHVECNDCHNPHRVQRNRLFNGQGDASFGTHDHGAPHTNIASGVLSGTWGVEPIYGTSLFLTRPVSYLVKNGAAGNGGSTDIASPHVTREYQVCLKCHSDFGYTDDDQYPIGSRPNLGDSLSGTTPGVNDLLQYTNQAMEFQAPFSDQGETNLTTDHRSWHPVVDSTGRSAGNRSMSVSAFLAPWDSNIGSQTMYCSDCHGSTTAATTVVPTGGDTGAAWGPHGSAEDFILKGTWSDRTGGGSREQSAPDPNNGLCFKCHDMETYASRRGNNRDSGFSGDKGNNLHADHTDDIEAMRCSWCHVAVPHGWKNKALLVNLNEVGPEAGNAIPIEVDITSNGQSYTQGPYYMNAKLKVRTWARSGDWDVSNCGSASGQRGSGRNWMENVCTSPP